MRRLWLLALLAGCADPFDRVHIGRGTGIFGGWDNDTCTCDTFASFAEGSEPGGVFVAIGGSIDSTATFDFELRCLAGSYDDYVYFNVPDRPGQGPTDVYGRAGFVGTAITEAASPEVKNGRTFVPVWIDALDVPSQEVCTWIEIEEGSDEGYAFSGCDIWEGTLKNARSWCEVL